MSRTQQAAAPVEIHNLRSTFQESRKDNIQNINGSAKYTGLRQTNVRGASYENQREEMQNTHIVNRQSNFVRTASKENQREETGSATYEAIRQVNLPLTDYYANKYGT